MSAIADEVELSKKHEEILGRRAVLLGLMQSRIQQQNSNRSQHLFESQAAQERNSRLLEDMQKLEERLNRRQSLPDPDIQALEMRYWTSVEESIPDWEQFLLGKGPHPTDPPGPCPRRAKQRASADPDHSLPPRPKAKPVK